MTRRPPYASETANDTIGFGRLSPSELRQIRTERTLNGAFWLALASGSSFVAAIGAAGIYGLSSEPRLAIISVGLVGFGAILAERAVRLLQRVGNEVADLRTDCETFYRQWRRDRQWWTEMDELEDRARTYAAQQDAPVREREAADESSRASAATYFSDETLAEINTLGVSLVPINVAYGIDYEVGPMNNVIHINRRG